MTRVAPIVVDLGTELPSVQSLKRCSKNRPGALEKETISLVQPRIGSKSLLTNSGGSANLYSTHCLFSYMYLSVYIFPVPMATPF